MSNKKYITDKNFFFFYRIVIIFIFLQFHLLLYSIKIEVLKIMLSSSCILFALLLKVIISHQTELNIHGTVANGWEMIQDRFKENFLQQRELGASIAIYHQEKLVVNLSGGWFNRSQTKSYNKDTLQLVFSATKGLVAATVALCVQRGLLNYSELVTKYWPEFRKNGKANTTVAHIMSHRAGLPFDSGLVEDYLNWTGMVHYLEQSSPVWEPGTNHGYHALTYGWLAGELVRRVDPKKRSLGQFVRDEIAQVLDIEFYIGLPSIEEYRVSPLDIKPIDDGSNETLSEQYSAFNEHYVHQAEIPGGNGITNARSLARFYASLIGDVEDNKHYKRLLNDDILQQATKSNTPANEIDYVVKVITNFSMGFLVMNEMYPLLGHGVFGHVGAGGSIGFAIPSKNLSFAYVTNLIVSPGSDGIDPRYKPILNEISAILNRSNSADSNKKLCSYFFLLCIWLVINFIFTDHLLLI
ncbi:hypothetical protein I4U23_020056 [Adineta vaga]|nr:hypothetical protein I4U23_020056 [Adineta vaga]